MPNDKTPNYEMPTSCCQKKTRRITKLGTTSASRPESRSVLPSVANLGETFALLLVIARTTFWHFVIQHFFYCIRKRKNVRKRTFWLIVNSRYMTFLSEFFLAYCNSAFRTDPPIFRYQEKNTCTFHL